jgi:hypothetical protein
MRMGRITRRFVAKLSIFQQPAKGLRIIIFMPVGIGCRCRTPPLMRSQPSDSLSGLTVLRIATLAQTTFHHSELAMTEKRGTAPPVTSSGEVKQASVAADFWQVNKHTHFLALLLMGIATLGTSWSGFQANLWNGKQTFRLADANRLGRLSSKNEMAGNQLRIVDAALFVEYARAYTEGNYKLSEFLLARMRPEFQPAMRAWLATNPLQNGDAPRTPFAMPEYHLNVDDQAQQQAEQADLNSQEAQWANRNSDTYTPLTVLFSISLFLAGLVTGFKHRCNRELDNSRT